MGYYTGYNIVVKKTDRSMWTHSEIEALIADMKEPRIFGYAVNDYDDSFADGSLHFFGNDIVKWYSCEEDMIALSQKHPECVFCVTGDGEDSDDFWKQYFYNGDEEFCRAELTYPKPTRIHWEE